MRQACLQRLWVETAISRSLALDRIPVSLEVFCLTLKGFAKGVFRSLVILHLAWALPHISRDNNNNRARSEASMGDKILSAHRLL